ncbi:MAG: hypothetical protein LBS50_01130 [Prevotellaceae bacterium]|jgi:hypothetical protein|nr:hypothetical protein [Prevotellaceae bacterium]
MLKLIYRYFTAFLVMFALLSMPATCALANSNMLNISELHKNQHHSSDGFTFTEYSPLSVVVMLWQNVKVPVPTISIGASITQPCPDKADFFHCTQPKINSTWQNIRHNNFVSNDLIQAHYFIFALRKIRI